MDVRRPIATLPRITPNVPEATIDPIYMPILFLGEVFAICGNIDAGINAAHIPIKAMATINKLKLVAYDEQKIVIASKRSPVTAILGKSNLSAAGPRKKKDAA